MTSVNQSTTFLPNVSPSSLGGNSATYQAKMNGGQGYGFEGNSIAPGRMEFSSYKSGGSTKRRRTKSKKQRKQRKSRRFRK